MENRLTLIDKEINELKNKLENLKGREIEVYSRIVGYHRAISGWNDGKIAEWEKRKVYDLKVSMDHLNRLGEKNEEIFAGSLQKP